MAGCGFTPATIDDMTLHDVMALLAHWRETPPTHEILAAVYGVKPAPLPDADDPSGIGELLAHTPHGPPTNGRSERIEQ